MFISDGHRQACIPSFCLYQRQDLNISRMQMKWTKGRSSICFYKNKTSICWEYWCRDRTRRVWCLQCGPGSCRDRPGGETWPGHWQCGPGDRGRHMSSCQQHQQWSLRPAVRRSVNEETRLSVKIQFCFGRVPIHSWTWQIFFIINHMLARTHKQLIAQRSLFTLWWEL